MDIMNDPLTDDLRRHEELIYRAETLLIETIYNKDFNGAKLLWEIISTYLPIVQTDHINNALEEYRRETN